MREIRPIGTRRLQLVTMHAAIGATSSVHCVIDGSENGGPFLALAGCWLWVVHIAFLQVQEVRPITYAPMVILTQNYAAHPRPLMLERNIAGRMYWHCTADPRSLWYAARITIH